MAIKLAPKSSQRERTPRRGATVAATALDSQSQSSQPEAVAAGASRKWYGVNSPCRPAPPQAKKVRTLEPGHDNHIVDPDVAVQIWKKLIRVATETASFVLSAFLICLRLPLLNPPL